MKSPDIRHRATRAAPPGTATGIYPVPNGRFVAKLRVNGKMRYFGTYDTREIAERVRDREIAAILAREPRFVAARSALTGKKQRPKPDMLDGGRGLNAADDAEIQERIAAVRAIKEDTERPWTVPEVRARRMDAK